MNESEPDFPQGRGMRLPRARDTPQGTQSQSVTLLGQVHDSVRFRHFGWHTATVGLNVKHNTS